MSEWARKRFWTEARAERGADGWVVLLDGRPVRTPVRNALTLPSEALARAVAEEWQAQEGEIDPYAMPLTRSANSAIDKVIPQFDAVAELLLSYGETDLLCYRADAPEALAARQAELWDPLLDWSRGALRAPLVATAGIVPVTQPAASRSALDAAIRSQDAFALTALHDLVTLSGSLVIGLAAQAGFLAPEELWARSRVDEDWQQAQWGTDAEAAEAAAAKRTDFLHAARFHVLSRQVA